MHENLNDVLDKIASDKPKGRATGESSLRELVANEAWMLQLTDKACQKILEALFTGIDLDTALYLTRNTQAVESRLSGLAELVRQLVEKKVCTLRAKAVRQIVVNCKKCISIKATDRLCIPVVQPLSKTLVSVCGYSPHVQHLSITDWEMLVKFCSRIMHITINDARRNSKIARLPSVVVDMLNCIYCLLEENSVASHEAFLDLYPNLTYFLNCFETESVGHFYTFACINRIISTQLTRNVESTATIATEVLPKALELLSKKLKDTSLEMEILIFIMHIYRPLDYVMKSADERTENMESTVLSLRDLLLPAINVKLDEIMYSTWNQPSDGWYSFKCLQKGSSEKGRNWLWLTATFRITKLCTHIADREPRKRQKSNRGSTRPMSNNNSTVYLEQFYDNLEQYPNGALACMALFLQEEVVFTKELIYVLEGKCNSNDSNVAGWAIICAALLFDRQTSDDSLKPLSAKLWQLTTQRFYDSQLSSPVCFCLAALVRAGYLDNGANQSEIESLINSFERSSPQFSPGAICLAKELTLARLPSHLSKILSTRVTTWISGCFDRTAQNARNTSPTSFETLFRTTECLLNLSGVAIQLRGLTLRYENPRVALNQAAERENDKAWSFLTLQSDSAEKRKEKTKPVPINARGIEVADMLAKLLDSVTAQLETSAQPLIPTMYIIAVSFLVLSGLKSVHQTEGCAKISDMLQVAYDRVEASVVQSKLNEERVKALHEITRIISGCESQLVETPEESARLTSFMDTILQSSINTQLQDDLDPDLSMSMMDGDQSQEKLLLPSSIASLKEYSSDEVAISHLNCASSMGNEDTSVILSTIKGSTPNVFVSTIDSMTFSRYKFSADDVGILVRCIGEKILQSYELQLSEIGLIATIRALLNTATVWPSLPNDSKTRRNAMDILQWLIKTVIHGQIQSKKVNFLMMKLIGHVMFNSGDDNDAEALLSKFLEMVQRSTGALLYECSQLYVPIFATFGYIDHDEVFTQISQTLDKVAVDTDDREQLAYQTAHLTFIAKHGWLITPPLYNLIEMAGIKFLSRYVQNSIKDIAAEYNLSGPRALFAAARDSVMYFYIGKGAAIDSFPYNAVGYGTISELLQDNLEVVVANTVAFSDNWEAKLQQISEHVQIKPEKLLETSFEKVIAFVRSDTWRDEDGDGKLQRRQGLERVLGRAKYDGLMRTKCVEIVAELAKFVDVKVLDESFIQEDLRVRIIRDDPVTLPRSTYRTITPKKFKDSLDELSTLAVINEKEFLSQSALVYMLRPILSHNVIRTAPEAAQDARRVILLIGLFGNEYRHAYPCEMIIRGVSSLLASSIDSDLCWRLVQLLLEDGKQNIIKSSTNFENLCFYVAEKLVMGRLDDHCSWFLQYLRSVQEEVAYGRLKVLEKCLLFFGTQNAQRSINGQSSNSRLLDHYDIQVVLLTMSNPQTHSFAMYCFSQMLALYPQWLKKYFENADRRRDSELVPKIIKWGVKYIQIPPFASWLGHLIGTHYLMKQGSVHLVQDPLDFKDDNAIAERIYERPLKRITEKIVQLIELKIPQDQLHIEQALRWFGEDLTNEEISNMKLIPESVRDSLQYRGNRPQMEFPKFSSVTRYVRGKPAKEYAQDINLAAIATRGLPPTLGILVKHVDGFAADLFPYFVLEALEGGSNVVDLISESFDKLFKLPLDDSDTKETLSLIMRTIAFLLHRKHRPGISPMALHLDYLTTAQVASKLGLYSLALQLLELDWGNDANVPATPVNAKQKAVLSEICEKLDDPDIYYCGVPQISSFQSAVDLLKRESQDWRGISYESALYDTELTNQSTSDLKSLAGSLSSIGLYGTSRLVDSSFGGVNHAWKLGQWDLPDVISSEASNDEIIFKLLKGLAVNSDEHRHVTECYQIAFQGLRSQDLSETLLESIAVISLADGVVAAKNDDKSGSAMYKYQGELLHNWTTMARIDEVENLLYAQRLCWRLVSKSMKKTSLAAAEALASTQLAEVARSSGQLHKTVSATVYLEDLAKRRGGDVPELCSEASLQSARVLWDMKEQTSAISILQSLASNSKFKSLTLNTAGLYSLLAEWSSKARHHDDTYIINNYLEKSTRYLRSHVTDQDNRGFVYHTFAVFCDERFHDAASKQRFDTVLKLRAMKREEVDRLKALLKGRRDHESEEYKDLKKQLSKDWKKLERDEEEFLKQESVREMLLTNSITYYIKSIVESDEYPEDASRFCAIWLANIDDESVNSAVQRAVDTFRTMTIVPWVSQLAARLSVLGNNGGVTALEHSLGKLLMKMCIEHPYHCLYQVLALQRGSDEVKTPAPRAKASRGGRTAESGQSSQMWDEFNDRMNIEVIENVKKFCNESRLLAKAGFDPRKKELRFTDLKEPDEDRNRSKSKTTNWSTKRSIDSSFWTKPSGVISMSVPLPTRSTPLDSKCDYSNIPTICAIEMKLQVASGLSTPKILKVKSTDGRLSKILFKGGDDLRQDAVMEQVFRQANTFFHYEEQARKRELSIRTYNIVPLDSLNGIIEFVPNTVSLLDAVSYYHSERSKRHKDITFADARKLISNASKSSDEERYEAFKEVEAKFKPVLRLWFYDKFDSSEDWFRGKVKYARSAATTSILGWVLGVGDRHTNNILLDQKTGEAIHIDLGIAFDQGKLLPIPETVPFRLSRDIVDGMGISGVEGVYRRCCHITLQVLRKERANVNTILSVLRYDPLHSWTVSPLKKHKVQDISGLSEIAQRAHAEGGDGEADRALSGVQQKLADDLSVEATVRGLIQEAMSSRNLALLFSGWGAHC